MLDRRVAALVLVLLAACRHGPAGHPSPATLRDELLRMEAEDQAVAGRLPTTEEEMRATQAEAESLSVRHVRRIEQMVQRHGWPTRSLVGEEAADAAWVLVQHADHDPAFQRRMLAVMEPHVASGEVKAKHYAYLWDRTHDPQRYGTQGECVARGVWKPRPIEAPSQVDARRASVGMWPAALAVYVQMMSAHCENRRDLPPPE